MTHRTRSALRQIIETVAIISIAAALWWIIREEILPSSQACWLIAFISGCKCLYFFSENVQELLVATRRNALYHRFMLVVMLNLAQVALSFGLDYWCLHLADVGSFDGIREGMQGGELLFECVYLSFLNITYFGYGDITPQIIPSKLVTMMELCVAFFTVLFLLSDFISLKEAIQKEE